MNRVNQSKKNWTAARRVHKDTVFRMLFQRRENLLSLYNAVNRTSYTDVDALTLVTLENAIYMNMKNDTAFILDDRLSLYEHQSTWNPNMPLRNQFYVSRTYQGFMKDESVYPDRKIQISTPHFIVFIMAWRGFRKELYLSFPILLKRRMGNRN